MTVVFRNTEKFKDQVSQAFVDTLTGSGSKFPDENILHNYRTFNYTVTLGIVSKEELKSGAYRTRGLDYIVFQSHGKPAVNSGKRAASELGQVADVLMSMSNRNNDYDFLLKDLYIKNTITKNRDIGTEFKLKILEPYGIETFLTSLYEGFTAKGYINTSGRSAAFVLKLEFVGYRDDKEEPEIIPFTTRYYPLILSNIKAEISQEGTIYDLTGAPLNDTGRYSDVNTLPQDINVTGETVEEMFKDLEKKLNQLMRSQSTKSGLLATEYKIEWLGESGQPAKDKDITYKILKSKMYDPDVDTAHKEFLKPGGPDNRYLFGIVNERTVPAENRKLTFNLNAKKGISNILDDIIVDSRYVVDRIMENWRSGYDSKTGMLEWWRVVTKVEYLDFDFNKNMPNFRIIYQIIPRKLPWQKLATIFFPDAQADTSDYEPFTVRRYDWNYTGKNKDVLSFRQHQDFLISRILPRNFGSNVDVPGKNVASTGNDTQQPEFKAVNQRDGRTAATNSGNITTEDSRNISQVGIRSNQETNPSFDLARDIFSIINTPYEQTTFNIEILGDPMWLGTQFIDNISFVDPARSFMFTSDGGIAFRTFDPCVRVLAYGPKDFNSAGFLAPGDSAQEQLLATWSGYYMVTGVESFFSEGTFKQKLTGYRMTTTEMKKIASSLERLRTSL